jgi:hypothetical protein
MSPKAAATSSIRSSGIRRTGSGSASRTMVQGSPRSSRSRTSGATVRAASATRGSNQPPARRSSIAVAASTPSSAWKITTCVAGSAIRAGNAISSPRTFFGSPFPSQRSRFWKRAFSTPAPSRRRSASRVATSQIARSISAFSFPEVIARAR